MPVLVLHRTGARFVPAEAVRWLAGSLPDARYVEVPGDELAAFFGNTDALMDEVEEFVAGTRTGADGDRAVSTMLITDVVGSTARAAELGDRRWRELLDWHHQEVRRLLARHGGVEIDTAGDGFLATFDLPSRAITCAVAISQHLQRHGTAIRAVLHTGEVVRVDGAVRGWRCTWPPGWRPWARRGRCSSPARSATSSSARTRRCGRTGSTPSPESRARGRCCAVDVEGTLGAGAGSGA